MGHEVNLTGANGTEPAHATDGHGRICPRLPIWSSPRIKVRGVSAGDATADNARVIAEGAARVAAFR